MESHGKVLLRDRCVGPLIHAPSILDSLQNADSCVSFRLQVRKINGVDVYVGEPKEGGDKSKALLFLSDVFGLGLVNNKVCPIFVDEM